MKYFNILIAQICDISIVKNVVYLCFCSLLFTGCKDEAVMLSRTQTNINKNWSFQRGVAADESNWESVHLPHTPKIEPLVVNDQWQGICWYKKNLTSDQLAEGKNHFLRFEGVMQEAEVWINGSLAAQHVGGYLPFVVPLTDYIHPNKNNEVLVKVVNTDNSTIPPGKKLQDLDFNTYGGIYRNVHLISTGEVFVTDAVHAQETNGGGVLLRYTQIAKEEASGFVKIHVRNTSSKAKQVKVQITFLDKDKKEYLFLSDSLEVSANTAEHLVQAFAIPSPKLWSPSHPNLYDVRIQIIEATNSNKVLDKVTIRTGIRSIELNEDGFFLNGEKYFITGTNRHQEYPYVGYAISDQANYRDAYKIKQAGFDFVRLSHYPHSESFMNACDELGLMVMNCIPGWQFYEDGAFVQHAYQDIRDMVRRDRNHPSVVFWENSLNESGMTDEFMDKANQLVKEELPYSDTYTAGWIDHPSYDLFIPARQHAKPPHYWNRYDNNNRKIFIAEYGDWEYYAQNAGFNQKEFKNLNPEERTSRQLRAYGEKRLLQQALNYQEAFNSNLKGKNTIGHANWLMFDYNRGYADDLEASGIADIFRIPKYAYYFYQSQKSPSADAFSKPMVYIASNWNKNSSLSVRVFSNTDHVELYLNDQFVTSKKRKDIAEFSDSLLYSPHVFELPHFVPGTLKALAFIDGKKVAEHRVSTPKTAKKIKLDVDESGLPLVSGVDDVVFVYAKIVDENNEIVADATNEISFSIVGNQEAEIIGPNKMNAEAGIATVLIRTNFTDAAVRVRAAAEGLLKNELVVLTK
jgi:beta-galactosidase